MKKTILCLIFLICGFQSFSQAPQVGSKEYYLQKSKNQKTTGWVLLAVGTAMAVGGGIAFNNNWDALENNADADLYGAIMVGGIVADLVSIPFFISAGRNARRAAKVSVSSQLINFSQANNSYVKRHPTVSVKIPF